MMRDLFVAVRASAATIAVCLVSLSGCGPLVELPGSGPAPRLFRIDPMTAINTQTVLGQDRPIVIVHEPEMPAALAIDRIAVIPQANEVQYLSDARWVDKPPRIIQSFLAESLNNLGLVTAIGAEAEAVSAEYHLFTIFDDFNITASANEAPPSVEISARIHLVEAQSSRLVASEQLSARSPLNTVDPHEAMNGFRESLGQIANSINDLIADTTVQQE